MWTGNFNVHEIGYARGMIDGDECTEGSGQWNFDFGALSPMTMTCLTSTDVGPRGNYQRSSPEVVFSRAIPIQWEEYK